MGEDRRCRRLAVLILVLGGCGSGDACRPSTFQSRAIGPAQEAPSRPSMPESTLAQRLFVSPSSYDFSRNPRLLDRIESGPHGYFRFINIAFSQAVCERFRSATQNVPPVNLHGDAHLEQYAVTDIGRGLTDFDDSSKGPAVLDLLRFGVSLHLALRLYAPSLECAPFYERFLEGYRGALEDPEIQAPEPEWVARIRARFVKDRSQYFRWIEQVMQPVPLEQKAGLKRALQDYVRAMVRKHPELDDNFFDVVDLGFLKLGVGSALDEKYLVRVQGPSEDPLDDVVLELKEVRSLMGIDCIEGTKRADPFRILLSQSRIAYRPYAYVGYIDFRGKKFWIHSWVDNYRELQLENLAREPELLGQVVYDVGVQLGRGHPKIAGEFELQLRQAQLRFLETYEGELLDAVEALSDATVLAWLRFKTVLRSGGVDP